MDISEQYIKMCDCLEIQEKSENYNDRCCFWANRLIDGSFSIWADLHKEDSIWLPRQDQIQEMMFSQGERVFNALEKLHYWWINPKVKVGYCESLEQLWLAFYMYEKHEKVWDGEEWLKKR